MLVYIIRLANITNLYLKRHIHNKFNYFYFFYRLDITFIFFQVIFMYFKLMIIIFLNFSIA